MNKKYFLILEIFLIIINCNSKIINNEYVSLKWKPTSEQSLELSSQQVNVPTLQPTKVPTRQPTKVPTRQPTKVPTRQPTRQPTVTPTFGPTLQPTVTPTFGPTVTPTFVPTLQPTPEHTFQHTPEPTFQPTPEPTFQPTPESTFQPTPEPTFQPTPEPTFQPTPEPTLTPSLQLTLTPSLQPTLTPSLQPTLTPSLQPTFQLTLTPSLQPTLTLSPTIKQPSFKPTKLPTNTPTIKPTSSPTYGNKLIIDSLTGPVTQNEINSFKYVMQLIPIGTNNYGNEYVYGTSGLTIESLGLMYEITHDIDFLNRMMEFTEGALNCRIYNMTWTGEYSYIWPNPLVTTEQGDVVGHIAYTVKQILLSSDIFNNTVLFGNSSYGLTYLNRALTYLYMANQTVNYLINFVSISDNYRYHFGNSSAFNTFGHKDANRPVPWNQQMMINNAFQRLSECFILINETEISVVYDTFVQASIDYFVDDAVTYLKNGTSVIVWSYSADLDIYKYSEDIAHGNYDLFGIFRIYTSGRYNVSSNFMTLITNTITNVLFLGPDLYATDIYQTPTTPTANWLNYGYILMGYRSYPIYTTISQSDMKAGGRQYNSPMVTASILWIKNYYYVANSVTSNSLSTMMMVVVTVVPTITLLSGLYMYYRYRSSRLIIGTKIELPVINTVSNV